MNTHGKTSLPASHGKAGVTPDQPTTTLTRQDWNGQFDSIKWALDEHVKLEDKGEYNFACLYGNEDFPERIDFYKSVNPHWNEYIAFTWFPPGSPQSDYSTLTRMYKTLSGFQDEAQLIKKRVGQDVASSLDSAICGLIRAKLNMNTARNQIARES